MLVHNVRSHKLHYKLLQFCLHRRIKLIHIGTNRTPRRLAASSNAREANRTPPRPWQIILGKKPRSSPREMVYKSSSYIYFI